MRSTSTSRRFWNSGRDCSHGADQIDKKELLDEKLGYATPISYEDWICVNHYGRLEPVVTEWLYKQEKGYIESVKDVTLKEIAERRILEFKTALRKYIL